MRGVRQLTSDEKKYYQKLTDAMRSDNPKQALLNADMVMPKTVMNAVFDELQTRHPLLSAIQFVDTTGITKMVMSENGEQKAQWGKLCDDVVKELLAGFTNVDMTLLKLSAFIPVCKAMLDLGPVWLDDFIRQVLYEALANGLEYGIVTGIVNGFATAVGFTISIVILAGLREKMEHNDFPEYFKGMPAVLLTAGLMAIAFCGFSGLL